MKNLGIAVAAVNDTLLSNTHYQQNLYVDLASARELDHVAHEYGFRSVTHLRDELQRRTTPRVAYGLIPPFIVG
jgi:hypothetical protein